jgi:hypothetical protein
MLILKSGIKFISIVILPLILLLFVFISPIAKYTIEKNGEKWIGRKITIESLWINIFTGSIHLEGFSILEQDKKNVFISVSDFYCNLELLKLVKGQIVVTPVTITKPFVNILQNGDKFNFDDILLRFSDTSATKKIEDSDPVKYFIDLFSINSGIVSYSNTLPKASVTLIDINSTTSPISYLDSIYNVKTDFSYKTGGIVNTNLTLNINSLFYFLKLKTEKLYLKLLYDYLIDYLKIKSLDGFVESELLIAGNFNTPSEIAVKGKVNVHDFAITDTTGEKLFSFKKYLMQIDTLNTKAAIYKFGKVNLDEPFIKFAMYNDGYNFDRILTEMATNTSTAPVEEYSNIFQMMAGYIKDISKAYLLNEYYFKEFRVNHGKLIFTDYTLEDKFQYVLDSLYIAADEVHSSSERIKISLNSKLNKSGNMAGSVSINPNGFEDMEIYYSVKDLLISDINPYSRYFVATRFLDGTVFFENKSTIENNRLKSVNRIYIEQIKVAKKEGIKSVYDLPVRLAVIILRNPKGDIDLEIPVEGDLNDPSYRIGKVVWQIFRNLIIKAVTAPFNLFVSAFGGKETDYKEIPFQYLQHGVTEEQTRVINNLVKVLNDKPELGLELVQASNLQDELEHLAIFNAKKSYLGFSSIDSLNNVQYQKVSTLSNKDSLFNQWVDGQLGKENPLVSIQEKCISIFGKEKLHANAKRIEELRNTKLKEYFVENNVSPDRILIKSINESEQSMSDAAPKFIMNFFPYDGYSESPAIKVKPETK